MSQREHFIEALDAELRGNPDIFDIGGLITRSGKVYALGTDTKVLSTAFELAIRPTLVALAARFGYEVEEPRSQNFYPDFTLKPYGQGDDFIAIDVKTTYRKNRSGTFSFTLGGYTSFIRTDSPTKNIVHSFEKYGSHYIIGFVYSRIASTKSSDAEIYEPENVSDIPVPYSDVDVFVREKWRIAGDVAGSGNTTNIGSVIGDIEDFRSGAGIFKSELEFLNYWRSYGKTAATRNYNNIRQFRSINAA